MLVAIARYKGFAAWVTVTVPNPLTRAQIEEMLDPEGRNVSAESAGTLAEKANDLLAAAHAKKFSLTAVDGGFLDFVIALRNYLSHRSSGSMKILRKRLSDLGTADPASHMIGTLTTVAIYLNARPPGAPHSRAKMIGHKCKLTGSEARLTSAALGRPPSQKPPGACGRSALTPNRETNGLGQRATLQQWRPRRTGEKFVDCRSVTASQDSKEAYDAGGKIESRSASLGQWAHRRRVGEQASPQASFGRRPRNPAGEVRGGCVT